jgi:hypothetical protein
MDATSQPILLNGALSAIVISILGLGLFEWDLATNMFPVWARILIVVSLFAHLIIRTSLTFISRKISEETDDHKHDIC